MKKLSAIFLLVCIVMSTVSCKQSTVINQVSAEEYFQKVESFDDVKDYMKDIIKSKRNNYSFFDRIFGLKKEMSVSEGAVRDDMSVEFNSAISSQAPMDAENESSGGSYTDTNTQVNGVDEADIIKTDGRYIYTVVENNRIAIVDTKNGVMKLVSEIFAKNTEGWISEMYIDDNRLVVIWHHNYYYILEDTGKAAPNKKDGVFTNDKVSIMPTDERYWSPSKQMVSVDVYDLTNMENVTLLKRLEVEGNLVSSRKIDGTMYLVTNKYNYIYNYDQLIEDNIIPYVAEDGSEPAKIAYDQIMILPDTKAEVFTNILTLDIFDTSKYSITSYLTGAGGAMYMNKTSLYLTDAKWSNDKTRTSVTKFSIDGANVNFVAAGEVNGYIINQFAMDEYNGYFRIATTDNMSNGIYVLDSTMKQVGKVDGLAEGEMIYSVRYTGDKAYMVTFKTMDPLFVINLSDPSNPKVEGELKIPGFSNYMHPVSDGTVLGLGRDTVEIYEKDRDGKEIVVGFRTGGIKLSLFDVSDPENPIEKKQIIVGTEYSNSEALYNHKAIMVDKERGIFGIPFEEYNYVTGTSSGKVMLFKVSENELEEYGTIELQDNTDGWYYNYYGTRVLSIDDTIYVKSGVEMHSYGYDNLKKIQTIQLSSK